ncbi:chloride channel protein [Evansella clarkii]|uniref:chloride channel protein n=1 Tax=Evansella clarkii TaxID=79879 RepID=UPI000998DE30|nr:chloride channel protein [Evansella clarkii]
MKNQYSVFVPLLLRWVACGAVIGVAAGSTTALLITANDLLGETREAHDWLLFLLPAGGVLIGALYKYAGKNSAKGNNLIFDDINGKGKIHLRMGLLVYIGTFITVLFGGSTGREGAAVQMGGSIAEALNRLFLLSPVDRRILLMSGISGGFGAAFGAPAAGAVFGMEVSSLGKLKYEALLPCFTASFIGHFTTAGWGVEHELLIIKHVPELTFPTAGKVIAAALLFSLVSVMYSKLRHGTQRFSEKHFKHPMLRGFIGGTAIIILVYLIDSRIYLGRGLETIEAAFDGSVPPFAFLGKMLFTAVTLGSGFVGGEAIPLFFMGSTLGNTLAELLQLPVSFLAALGLIGVFCGGANTPLAALLLGIEMFHGKGIEYILLVCVITYIFSGRNGVWPAQTIYEPKSRLWSVQEGKTITKEEREQSPGQNRI